MHLGRLPARGMPRLGKRRYQNGYLAPSTRKVNNLGNPVHVIHNALDQVHELDFDKSVHVSALWLVCVVYFTTCATLT